MGTAIKTAFKVVFTLVSLAIGVTSIILLVSLAEMLLVNSQ